MDVVCVTCKLEGCPKSKFAGLVLWFKTVRRHLRHDIFRKLADVADDNLIVVCGTIGEVVRPVIKDKRVMLLNRL